MVQARLLVLAGLGIAIVAALGVGGRALYRAGYDAASLDHVKDVELIERTARAAELAASKAISNIQVKHVTIRQNLEKELTRDVVYRDCVASDRVLELTNEALTGRSNPSANSVVSAPEPANE